MIWVNTRVTFNEGRSLYTVTRAMVKETRNSLYIRGSSGVSFFFGSTYDLSAWEDRG